MHQLSQSTQIIVWSDYLCPWCWPAAVHLRKLVDEFAGKFSVVHRAYILRGEENPSATFTEYYLQNRQRAREMTELPYFLPELGAKYPSSSYPAQIAAKWVSKQAPFRFEQFDAALFSAFFERAEDISDPEVLGQIAKHNGIDPFEVKAALSDKKLRAEVVAEHEAAQRAGINGVPCVIIGGEIISGAVALDVYRNAATRALS